LAAVLADNIPPDSECSASSLLAEDHSYSVRESPRKLKRKLNESQEKLSSVSDQLKYMNRKQKRLEKRVTCLQEILRELQREQLMKNDISDLLEHSFSGAPLELFMKKLEGDGRKQYPAALRAFALRCGVAPRGR
jgi:predicted nuclease with TOPRIM domain